ncbi:MAG: transglutaminase domain-containing protein, partial [Myxococcaceae bacterium]|nr:transglutaminase domain-containing protein [Myxococcaceae bacterium]
MCPGAPRPAGVALNRPLRPPRHGSVRSLMRCALFCLVVVAAPALAQKGPPLSDAVTVARPPEGEFFGVYLQNQKVGWMFSQVKLNQAGDQLVAVNELHFLAKVGTRITDRMMKETKVFEAKPGGKLLSLRLEQKGDGGDQILDGLSTKQGLKVIRTRPGKPDETLLLPAPKEVAEDADQVRVALKRRAKVEGIVTDSTDLKQYVWTTTPDGTETRTLRGVKVKLARAVTVSEKDKVPQVASVDEKGRMLEVQFGPTMMMRMEPEDQARRIDLVEVFSLTRVKLPKPAPPEARRVPGTLTLVMSGLPERFQVNTYRQTYERLDDKRVAVKLSAFEPKARQVRPLADPNGGKNLESDIIVEASAPEIVKQARQIAGQEKDAWAAALKINDWVNKNVQKDYGASSDRATDVLKTLKGDCTEHSLLMVALLRAVGVPARRADGVVYLMNEDQVPALYWHEWVEAYVGEWTQLDPTFGQAVADATHFKVGEDGNSEITPLIGSLVVSD